MDKIISFIIPSYNVEQYLEKCLSSFLNPQAIEQMEVIIVDDGSKDRTARIAGDYVKQYPELFRLISKENGGHGSVINTAAEIATGKYLKILDADDWFVSENMPQLLDSLEKLNADVVITNFDMVDAEERFRQPFVTENVEYEKIYTMDDLEHFPKSVYACSTFHGIFYRRAFYQSIHIRMSEKVFYEDQEYATLPFCYVSSITFLNLTIYQYLVGRPGQSVSHENQVKRLPEIKYILNSLIRFYQEHYDMSDAKKRYFQYKIGAVILSYYVAALLKNPDRRKGRKDASALRKELQANSRDLMCATEKKYWITKCLHMIHMTPDGLERVKRTHLYYILKKFI